MQIQLSDHFTYGKKPMRFFDDYVASDWHWACT